MSSYDFFWALGDGLDNMLALFYDNIGNIFNDFLLIFGFLLFGYWMRLQSKFIREAANNPNQIK